MHVVEFRVFGVCWNEIGKVKWRIKIEKTKSRKSNLENQKYQFYLYKHYIKLLLYICTVTPPTCIIQRNSEIGKVEMK